VVVRTLLDALDGPALIVDAEGRLVEVGAAARVFLGDRLATATHIGDLADAVDPVARPRLREAVPHLLRRTGQWRGPVDLIDAAGNTVPHEVVVRMDPGGGAIVLASDTGPLRARDAAVAESRAKDEFIARLGHELRTPLNAMLGFAQLLELEPLPRELHDDVERIITGGRHMQALIEDVQDLARLRAGQGNITKGPVDLLEIVQGVVELVEPLAERRGIRRVIYPADRVVADADRRRLWQVLLNLVGNALKYGREGGSVRVGIVPVTGGRVRIEVEDDGAGLPPEAMNRLFRPFDRLGAERTGVEGSGLGLALSHALVTAMGGVLTAASRYGVGSVFAVVLDAIDARFDDSFGFGDDGFGDDGFGDDGFDDDGFDDDGFGDDGFGGGVVPDGRGVPGGPAERSGQAEPGDPAGRAGAGGNQAGGGQANGSQASGNGHPRPAAGGRWPARVGADGEARRTVALERPAAEGNGGRRVVPRVVHVSGDPSTRMMVTAALGRMFGADTVTVPRAALAMDAVRRAAPALVIVDARLPDATPGDLLSVLSSHPDTQGVPALVLATEDDPRDRLRLRQAGAVDVVRAPLEAAVLVQASAGRLVALPDARGAATAVGTPDRHPQPRPA